MKKIPTLYVRDPDNPRNVTRIITPGCEWVIAGEGTPTRKYDGTCVKLDHLGDWWARREVKPGKTPPLDYLPIQVDPLTGKTVGWEPIEDSSFAKFHAEALDNEGGQSHLTAGTYELCGPRINGNPENLAAHAIFPHGWSRLSIREDLATIPLTHAELGPWLHARPYEGIVWHRRIGDPNTDMVKIKKRDFPTCPA